jgi:hypothetical protein
LQCINSFSSQRTQVIWHIAELPDHLGIAEIAGGKITGAAERDGADVAFLARQRLRAHHDRNGIEALRRLAGSNAVAKRVFALDVPGIYVLTASQQERRGWPGGERKRRRPSDGYARP